MINIAVVEDDESSMQQLIGYLNQYGDKQCETFQITTFTDGYELLEKYRCEFDIILLDVQMPLVDGMTTAEEIRMSDSKVIIIFITNMAQYAIRGYAVDALDYILKPINFFAFSQCLNKAILRIKKSEACYIAIRINKGGVQKIDISQIYYIESQGHNLIFHTTFAEFVSPGKIADMEEKLQDMYFFRGNKGYLINLRHVDSIREGCAVVNGNMLTLSRSRKNAFLTALTNYIGETT